MKLVKMIFENHFCSVDKKYHDFYIKTSIIHVILKVFFLEKRNDGWYSKFWYSYFLYLVSNLTDCAISLDAGGTPE